MWYLMQQYWLVLLIAFIVGVVVGWSSRRARVKG